MKMRNFSGNTEDDALNYWKWGAPNSTPTKVSRKNDWAPLVAVPLMAAIMLVSSVFLLIIFRQNPALVITTVAGCLIVITVYITLSTVSNMGDTYE